MSMIVLRLNKGLSNANNHDANYRVNYKEWKYKIDPMHG